MPRHVRKGDEVYVISGKDRGHVGTVIKVLTDKDRVVVEGANIRTKHVKRDPQRGLEGGVVRKEMPIHISNVQPAVNGKPTRVRFETRDDGSKVRVAVTDGSVIGEPIRQAK